MNDHDGSVGATGRPPIPTAILDGRVVAIGRGLDPERVLAIAEALVAGGVRSFEITLNSPSALAAIESLAGRFDPDELLVGVGTVVEIGGAEAAVAAGARFLVTPHTDLAVVRWAAERGVPAFPGALTPTEIVQAWQAGASAIKLFPASAVGPSFIRELRGPFPEIPIIPTGGVSVDTAPAFIEAGAVAVGMGSWLTGGGDPEQIRERAGAAVRAVAGATAAPAALAAQQQPAAVGAERAAG